MSTDNHKPTLSSDLAPSQAHLKPSAKDGTYNLGFTDNGDKYTYNGVRTGSDGKYVLVFDPVRKAFVLHRLDSMFHMNVTRTPTNTDVESLQEDFPRLEVKGKVMASSSSSKKQPAAPTPTPPTKTTTAKAKESGAKAPSTVKGKQKTQGEGKAKKQTEKSKVKDRAVQKQAKDVSTAADSFLTLPDPAAAKVSMPPPERPKSNDDKKEDESHKKKKKKAQESDEESDEDDDDGGLLVEYPEGSPPARRFGTGVSSSVRGGMPLPPIRRFSQFVRDQEDADADADAEYEDDVPGELVEDFEEPAAAAASFNGEAAGWNAELAEADADVDLEAALAAELEQLAEDQSEISEED